MNPFALCHKAAKLARITHPAAKTLTAIRRRTARREIMILGIGPKDPILSGSIKRAIQTIKEAK